MLEQKIDALIESVDRLTAAIDRQETPAAGNTASKSPTNASSGKKVSSKASPAKASSKKSTGKAAGKKVTMQQVSALVLDLANKYGREQAIEVLETFKVKSVKNLPEDQYAAACKALKAKIQECEAAKDEEADDDDDGFDLDGGEEDDDDGEDGLDFDDGDDD